MTAPADTLKRFLGCRNDKRRLPNICDADSKASVDIAAAMLDSLGLLTRADGKHRIAPPERTGQSSGAVFEAEIAGYLSRCLRPSGRRFSVERDRHIWDYEQYAHLDIVRRLIEDDRSGTLRQSIGTDYHVKPDVTVGLEDGGLFPFLHASVSCKLTIRSDRAQNIRLEATSLIRHRRGRLPHIVAVTAEPLPSRLAALARGTGEIDTVYHVALPELTAAVNTIGGRQLETLTEMSDQARLLDVEDLVKALATR